MVWTGGLTEDGLSAKVSFNHVMEDLVERIEKSILNEISQAHSLSYVLYMS